MISHPPVAEAAAASRRGAVLALSLIVAAALSACGGGGHGNPVNDPVDAGAQASVDPTLNDDPITPPTAASEPPPLPLSGIPATGSTPVRKLSGVPERVRTSSASTLNATPLGQLTPAVPGALNIARIEIGQTHMMPNGVKQFDPTPDGKVQTLRLRPYASALAVVDLSASDAVDPVIEAWWDGTRVGTVRLNPPSKFPKTEDGGPAYRTGSYSVVLPQEFIERGMTLKVSARNYAAGNALPLDVTGDLFAEVRILPFFFFGATEANAGRPVDKQGHLPPRAAAELQARMPVWIDTEPHLARKVEMDTVTLPPNGTRPARLALSANDAEVSELGEAIGWSRRIAQANGESRMPVLTYSPVAYRYTDGRVKSSNTGGLAYVDTQASPGAWWSASGDWDYAGVFIHEMTHNFGLGHAGGSYDKGTYPYPGGSLKGSNWGWDSAHDVLLPPFVPSSSGNFARCASLTDVQRDEQGRCVKQDIMQGGSGWQASSQRFGPVADFTAAFAQASVAGKTVWPLGEDSQGNAYFQQLNPTTREFERLNPVTSSLGFWGIAEGLPKKMNVPVYTLMMSVSMTTPEASQIHAPLQYEGNLLYRIDPTNADDLASIKPRSKGKYRDYCWGSGCDFTLHVTYADGSQRYELVQDGLRPWCSFDADIRPESQDPLKSASFRQYAFNVPGDKPLKRVELLYTPRGYQGLPANPKVLVSRDF